MLDVSGAWTIPPTWEKCTIKIAGALLRPVLNLRQILLSGDIPMGLGRYAPGIGLKGPGDPAIGEKYAVRLASNRGLLVSESEVDMSEGFSDWSNGYAISDVSDAFAVFEIEGPLLRTILSHGAALSMLANQTGGAAMTTFGDILAIVYFRETKNCARIHVDRSLAPYLWRWFEVLGSTMRDVPEQMADDNDRP